MSIYVHSIQFWYFFRIYIVIALYWHMHVSSLASRYYYSPQSRSIGLLGHTNHLDAPIALFAVRIVLIRLVLRALITVECDDKAILMRYKSKPRIEQYWPHFSKHSNIHILGAIHQRRPSKNDFFWPPHVRPCAFCPEPPPPIKTSGP